MKPHSIFLIGIAFVSLLAIACSSGAPAPASAPASKPASSASASPTPDAPAAQAAEPAKAEGGAAPEPAKAETPAAAPAAAAAAAVAPLVAAVEQKKEEGTATVKIVTDQGKAMIATFQTVYFDFDKYNIKPEFQSIIKQDAEILKKASGLKVVVEGHCDERGTTEYNLALGQRRATAVLRALEAEGVSKNQMKTISYGKERPIAMGHDEDSWSKNRRGILQDGSSR